MKLKNYFPHFKKALLQPCVFIFIQLGAAVMFLVFLTDANALEIAIPGIASLFIGIAVNNLSSLEIHTKDEQKLRSKMRRSLKILVGIQTSIRNNAAGTAC